MSVGRCISCGRRGFSSSKSRRDTVVSARLPAYVKRGLRVNPTEVGFSKVKARAQNEVAVPIRGLLPYLTSRYL
jgi:hypothetical protein